jgi:hypothetical protein
VYGGRDGGHRKIALVYLKIQFIPYSKELGYLSRYTRGVDKSLAL